MPAAIDTLKFAKRLRQANFTEPQAEALAEAVAEATVENVATKLDIASLRAELKQDIADLRNELHREIAALRVDMAAMESRMPRWMGAGLAATIAVLATLIQFAHH
jgi:hypothetical protein